MNSLVEVSGAWSVLTPGHPYEKQQRRIRMNLACRCNYTGMLWCAYRSVKSPDIMQPMFPRAQIQPTNELISRMRRELLCQLQALAIT